MALTRRRLVALAAAATCVVLAAPALADPVGPPFVPNIVDFPQMPRTPLDCHYWFPEYETLYDAVRYNDCVALPRGEFELPSQVNLRTGREIYGASRGETVLRAAKGFQGNSLFATNGSQGVVLNGFTVDIAGRATGGLGATGMLIEDVRVTGAKCWGIGVNGPNMVVRRSEIDNNGGRCPVAPPGAGFYVTGPKARVVIENSLVRDNTGPGIDGNRASHGRLTGTTFRGNTGWAAVSIYGGSRWIVRDNVIDHSASGKPQRYHHFCNPGRYDRAPRGSLASGIMICHDSGTGAATHNVVERNTIKSGYGLMVIGADDLRSAPGQTRKWWVPRKNRFTDNRTRGSVVGCADDLRPGQWPGDENVWDGNDCRGAVADRRPVYF